MAPSRARTAALVLALGVLARGAVAQPPAATVRLTDVRVERQGDAVTVETIEERHIVLRTPHGPVEMRLEDPRPAKPVAAPGPPR